MPEKYGLEIQGMDCRLMKEKQRVCLLRRIHT